MNFRNAIILSGLLLAACAPNPTIPPTPTKTPEAVQVMSDPVLPATPAPVVPSLAPSPDSLTQEPRVDDATDRPPLAAEPSRAPSETAVPPTPDQTLPQEHYWLSRPIPAGWVDYLDRTYPYGSTAGGKYAPHTGGDFWNPVSTPVIAVANATVIHAGTDDSLQFGPRLNFYGGLIVMQLNDYTYNASPIYVLYGHLADVFVESGQVVTAGDIIGAVGGTGVAIGPHLHFEVRLNDAFDYETGTRNVDLWIKPYPDFGTLAGRVVDSSGNYMRNVVVTISNGIDTNRWAWTYAGAENISDDKWGENFTYGDLPEGWYTVSTRGKRTYTQDVYIHPNRTTWVEFIFE